MVSAVDGRAGIDAALVARLVAEQFPQWADLPIRPVAEDGWDNRTYRLGDSLSVRLPTADGYVAAVAKENTWLPILARQLTVPIPEVVGVGLPTPEFPRPWSVRRWLPGRTAGVETVPDPVLFAGDLAEFIRQLQGVDASNGPAAGEHSFFRGCSPAHYDDEVQAALRRWGDRVEVSRARTVWSTAVESIFTGPPSWFHGDLAPGNLLVKDGRLSAVIDFGTSGVGDPACELVIAWTLFTGAARSTFRDTVRQDRGQWARARGWALWKALIGLTGAEHDHENLRIISDVLAEGG